MTEALAQARSSRIANTDRHAASRSIEALAREIGAACAGPEEAAPGRICSALGCALSDPALLEGVDLRPQPGGYARIPLHGDPQGRFTVLAIVWGADQFSPPHAHHTWCAYGVVRGPLQETLFAWDAARGRAEPRDTRLRQTGYVCHARAGLDQIHRLGNSGISPAVSIHVYGVGCERVGTDVNRTVPAA